MSMRSPSRGALHALGGQVAERIPQVEEQLGVRHATARGRAARHRSPALLQTDYNSHSLVPSRSRGAAPNRRAVVSNEGPAGNWR